MSKKKSRTPAPGPKRRMSLQQIAFVAIGLIIIASFIFTLFM